MTSNLLQTTSRQIQAFSEWTGRAVAWLTLAMVLVTFAVVVFRYAFDMGWIWLQETISYMHAFVFMLGAAYTLKHDEHVRVDIFYHKFSPNKKALVDLLGNLLLVLPVCIFIFSNSWGNVSEAWQRLEGSEETGGLDLVFVLKSIMLLMPLMLSLQATAIVLRNILIIRGEIEAPKEYQRENIHG